MRYKIFMKIISYLISRIFLSPSDAHRHPSATLPSQSAPACVEWQKRRHNLFQSQRRHRLRFFSSPRCAVCIGILTINDRRRARIACVPLLSVRFPHLTHYSNPEVYQLIRWTLGVMHTGGNCAHSPQGSFSGKRITTVTPSFINLGQAGLEPATSSDAGALYFLLSYRPIFFCHCEPVRHSDALRAAALRRLRFARACGRSGVAIRPQCRCRLASLFEGGGTAARR